MLKYLAISAVCAALVLLASLVGMLAFYSSEQPKTYDQEQPSATKDTERQKGGTGTSKTAQNLDGKGNQKREWYYSFVDRPTDWLLVLFNGLLVLATVSLFISGERSVEATRISANAAQKSAKVAEDSLTLLNRPFIFPENMKVNRDTFKESILATQGQLITFPRVEFELVNYGKTPALLREYLAKVAFYEGELPVPPDYMAPVPVGQIIIGPGDKITKERLITRMLFKTPTEEEVRKLIGHQMHFYFFGYARYDDIFGNRHTQGFCFAFEAWTDAPADGSRDRFLQIGGEAYNYDKQEKASETEPFWWGIRGDIERAKERAKTVDQPPPATPSSPPLPK